MCLSFFFDYFYYIEYIRKMSGVYKDVIDCYLNLIDDIKIGNSKWMY